MSEASLLHHAVQQGDVAKIQAWLKLSKPVDPVDGEGHTPLLLAVRRAEGEAFRLLLDAGANPHAVNQRDMTPLFIAATQGLASMVPALIAKGANVNQPAQGGLTPLIAATIDGHAEIVRLLLEAGADPKLKDQDGHTVQDWAKKLGHKSILAVLKNPKTAAKKASKEDELLQAARTGDGMRLQKCLAQGGHLEHRDEEGCTPLMLAAQANKRHAIQVLLAAGASPYTETRNGYNAILWAANSVDALRTFRDAGIDLNHGSKLRGVTALMFAAQQGFADVVQFLIDAGVNLHVKDQSGATALDRAERISKRAIVALLKEKMGLAAPARRETAKPGQPKAIDPAKADARQLLKAARSGNVDVIAPLLVKGVALDCRDRDGCTPLMLAAQEGRSDAFNLLLQAGADPHARSPSTGIDALYVACASGHIDIVKELLARGVAVNPPPAQDSQCGYTALMAATLSGKLELVKLLVEAGADVHAQAFGNETALTWAKQQKHKAIVAYLKQVMGPPAEVPGDSGGLRRPARPGTLGAAVQDFALTATQPAFQDVLKMIETVTGKKPNPSRKRSGVYLIGLSRKSVQVLADRYQLPKRLNRNAIESILEKLLEEVRQRGFLLMVDSLWEPGDVIKARLFPTSDPYAVMASCGTNGINYGHSAKKVIAWFRKLAGAHPFVMTGCGHDHVAGRFIQPVADPMKLAKEMLAFCPDLSDGTATPAAIAKGLKRSPQFFFWWD